MFSSAPSDVIVMGKGADSIQKRLAGLLALLAAAFSLTACGTVAGVEAPSVSEEKGAVVIRISLGSTALAKKADTNITLDTLHLALTSPGCETRLVNVPVSGNINAGSQVLTAKVEGLKPLRNWKVVAFSRDDVDTVLHKDSTTFYVKPADTANVSMLMTPRYSVLVARFVSTWNKVDGIKKLELRVNGSVVDDTVFASKLKNFDVRLSHKYLKANTAASVEMRAYTSEKIADLRYVQSVQVNAAASQDSQVTIQLLGI